MNRLYPFWIESQRSRHIINHFVRVSIVQLYGLEKFAISYDNAKNEYGNEEHFANHFWIEF